MRSAYEPPTEKNLSSVAENTIAVLSLLLLVLNLYGLFTRQLIFNLLGTVILCSMLWYLVAQLTSTHVYRKFSSAGIYLLLLGLFFDAYEGGIKKDPSTYSYYFVTAGLAFFMLLLFSMMAKRTFTTSIVNYFSQNGKNPMVAYVVGNLFLLPLLQLTQTKQYIDLLNSNAWLGFLRGVVFTGLVSLITLFFVKRKWFWKT